MGAAKRRVDLERAKPARDRMTQGEIDAWARLEQTEQARRAQIDTTLVQRAQMAVTTLSNDAVKNNLAHNDALFKKLTSGSAEFLIELHKQGLELVVERSAEPTLEDEVAPAGPMLDESR